MNFEGTIVFIDNLPPHQLCYNNLVSVKEKSWIKSKLLVKITLVWLVLYSD